MEKNLSKYIYACIVLGFATWLILIAISGDGWSITLESCKKIPTVVTINVFIWTLFIKWGWKLKILQNWLVDKPILEGTWEGIIKSSWINPETNERIEPIDITVVIRQTFLHMNFTVYSKEMISNSYSASYKIDKDAGVKYVTYTYTSKPKVDVRDRSVVHDGTVVLNIIGDTPEKLIGEYWTNRKTTGEMELKFISKETKDITKYI